MKKIINLMNKKAKLELEITANAIRIQDLQDDIAQWSKELNFKLLDASVNDLKKVVKAQHKACHENGKVQAQINEIKELLAE